MKHATQAVIIFMATLILTVGMACNMSLFASPAILPLTTMTPSPQPTATTAPPTQAQNPPVSQPVTQSSGAPVILLLTSGKGFLGDIYKWDVTSQTLKQLTSWGYNFPPRVSPDGQWLAYLSVSTATVSAITAGQAMNAERYANVWLFNPYTEASVRIADQPQGAAYPNLIKRTGPVWSPDGNLVAWTEVDAQGERLAIYGRASQSTVTYSLNIPPACCEGGSRALYWGHSGIAIVTNEGTPPNDVKQVVYVFNPQGQQIARSELATDFYPQYGWTSYNNREFLAGPTNGELTLVDPFNNAPAPVSSYPEMFAVNAPNGLSIHPAKNPVLWTITRQGQPLTDVDDIQHPESLSIAPDGSGVVYSQGNDLDGGRIFAYLANGQTVPIAPNMRVLAVTWGATAWRIHP